MPPLLARVARHDWLQLGSNLGRNRIAPGDFSWPEEGLFGKPQRGSGSFPSLSGRGGQRNRAHFPFGAISRASGSRPGGLASTAIHFLVYHTEGIM